jgi:hypothetical protein
MLGSGGGGIVAVVDDALLAPLVYHFLLSLRDQERSVSELRQNLIACGRSATATKYLGRG